MITTYRIFHRLHDVKTDHCQLPTLDDPLQSIPYILPQILK